MTTTSILGSETTVRELDSLSVTNATCALEYPLQTRSCVGESLLCPVTTSVCDERGDEGRGSAVRRVSGLSGWERASERVTGDG